MLCSAAAQRRVALRHVPPRRDGHARARRSTAGKVRSSQELRCLPAERRKVLQQASLSGTAWRVAGSVRSAARLPRCVKSTTRSNEFGVGLERGGGVLMGKCKSVELLYVKRVPRGHGWFSFRRRGGWRGRPGAQRRRDARAPVALEVQARSATTAACPSSCPASSAVWFATQRIDLSAPCCSSVATTAA